MLADMNVRLHTNTTLSIVPNSNLDRFDCALSTLDFREFLSEKALSHSRYWVFSAEECDTENTRYLECVEM